MKRFSMIIAIATLFMVSQLLTAQDKVAVDYSSKKTYMLKNGELTILKLVGEVFFYHNGAIINCDTAYYTPQTNRFEGIGSVIVNQDSINIYGDRIIYNKETSIARVIAPLVKITDPSTVMYTPHLEYNTLTYIAEYEGGATVQYKETTLESRRGFYDTQRHVVLLREDVSIKHPDYIAKNDSLDFFMDTEELYFECLTYIWRTNGDILKANRGKYLSQPKLYEFEDDSYIMTKEQELWADTINYYSLIEEIILRGNIQILDSAKRALSFGDYGQFWRNSENVLLTNNPSILNYSEDSSDTLFMRSDTLFVRPYLEKIKIDTTQLSDSLLNIMAEQSDSIAIDSNLVNRYSKEIEKGELELYTELPTVASDSTKTEISTPETDTLALDTLAGIVADSSVVDIQDMTKAQYKAYKKRLREEKKLARKQKFLKWLEQGGMTIIVDTINNDTLPPNDGEGGDATLNRGVDSTNILTIKNAADSSDYIVRGFGQSRIFNQEFQLICDSIVTETVDSTTTFIGRPVLWNQSNQILSQRMRSFTKNGEIERTRLFGKPIISQFVESERYNQIKGDYMDAMFRNNEIYRLYVTDASEALFYKQAEFNEKDSPIEALIFATSKNMTINIDSMTISEIKFYDNIETITYPINKIDRKQILFLDGFEWLEELRPTKAEVFDRKIVDSYRKQAEGTPKPNFDITTTIEEKKKSLIESGQWRDRTDLIPLSKKVFRGE